MANSAAFNATGRVIIDLGVALTRLGAQKVYRVVFLHAMQDKRRTESLRSIAGPLDHLWSESVPVAHFCYFDQFRNGWLALYTRQRVPEGRIGRGP
jgi:HD-like signal output (HDOD) protein